MSTNTEAGIRRNRLEFARVGATEHLTSEYPTDPDFEPYSSVVTGTDWSIDSNIDARRGLGTVDPTGHLKGTESAELTVSYELERWLVEGGAAGDASYDGIVRTIDNLLPNAHLVVERIDRGMLHAESTIAGTEARPSRTYKVASGAKIDSVTLNGDPSDAQPVTVELTYRPERIRVYQIDQPLTDDTLSVYSTSDDDTGDVTIEDEGAATTETVTLTGTTPVATTATFPGIDAIHVPAYHEGDIIVEDAGGVVLAEIGGGNRYHSVESDSGVPSLGAGSHADFGTVGTPEVFIGDRLEKGTDPIAYEFNSAELTVENNIEETERGSTFALELSEGNRDTQLSVTAFGEAESYQAFVSHLSVIKRDITWEMDGGTITLPNAVLMEPGNLEMEEGQAIATIENVFEGEGIEVSEA